MDPFLKMGVTLASFQSGGTTPDCIDLLKITARAGASLTFIIKNIDVTPSGPGAEPGLSFKFFF